MESAVNDPSASTVHVTLRRAIEAFCITSFRTNSTMSNHVAIAIHQLERFTRQNQAPPEYRFLRKWRDDLKLARDSQAFDTEHSKEMNFSFN